jgi:3-oxoacyl-(acyl-carrier-protein) synthase
MNNSMVIVDLARVDADTENSSPILNDRGIWIYPLNLDYGDMLSAVLEKVNPKICSLVSTIITCNFMYDSYSREKCLLSDRFRPREVLNALGISLSSRFYKKFPNVEHMFNAESACSSGLLALEVARPYLINSDKVILVAGIDKSTSPAFINLFNALSALSTDIGPCSAPFSQHRTGFAMGEGAAILAVASKNTAEKFNLPVVATIDSINNKTCLGQMTDPSDLEFLKSFINDTLKSSHRTLDEFAYWDAHATGTPIGDQVEYELFSEIFKNSDLPISSFKGKVGHCMSTSALVEIVNAIQNIKQNLISPNYNLSDPMVNDSRIITSARFTDKKTFIKTSFGFGGRNGAAVITVN